MQNISSARRHTSSGLFVIIIWSFTALLAVELKFLPAFELFFLEFVLAFLVTLVRYILSKDKKSFFNFRKRDLFIASLALTGNQACYFLAFRHAPAIQVDLINYLWPTFLVLFSSFLPKEKFCIAYLISCLICLWGIYNLLAGDSSANFSSEHMMGYLLAFGAAIIWTLYSLYTRYHKSNSSNCISWACGFAALFNFTLHMFSNETFVLPSIYESCMIILVGGISIGLAFYLWDLSLKKGHVKFLGLASYGIPILSVMILVLFGKAPFEPRMITTTIAITLAPLIPLIKNKFTITTKAKVKASAVV